MSWYRFQVSNSLPSLFRSSYCFQRSFLVGYFISLQAGLYFFYQWIAVITLRSFIIFHCECFLMAKQASIFGHRPPNASFSLLLRAIMTLSILLCATRIACALIFFFLLSTSLSHREVKFLFLQSSLLRRIDTIFLL